MVKANEMPGGPVTLLSFNFLAGETTTNQSWSDFKLYVVHTDITSLSTNFADNYSGNTPQLAYAIGIMTMSTVNGEWFGWKFNPPIHYDGKSNLIFELTFVDPKGNISVKIGNGTNRCLFATEVNAPTGDFLGNDQAMRIYYDPNTSIGNPKKIPASDMKLRLTDSRITASLPSLVNNKEVSVAICTMTGKIVYTQNVLTGNSSIECNITKLPAGMYTFAVKSGEVRFFRKFCIIQ